TKSLKLERLGQCERYTDFRGESIDREYEVDRDKREFNRDFYFAFPETGYTPIAERRILRDPWYTLIASL
ncbi:MAG: hypothetical protein WBE41_12050, partial [Terracidiphilus sp.]